MATIQHMNIPNTTHQVWVGGDMPSWASAGRAQLIPNLPQKGWEHRFWDEVALEGEFGEDFASWSESHSGQQLANKVRFELLRRFGGWYLDLDIVSLGPVDFSVAPTAKLVLARNNVSGRGQYYDIYLLGAPGDSDLLTQAAAAVPTQGMFFPVLTHMLRQGRMGASYAVVGSLNGDERHSDLPLLHCAGLSRRGGPMAGDDINAVREAGNPRSLLLTGVTPAVLDWAPLFDRIDVLEFAPDIAQWLDRVAPGNVHVHVTPRPIGRGLAAFEEVAAPLAQVADAAVVTGRRTAQLGHPSVLAVASHLRPEARLWVPAGNSGSNLRLGEDLDAFGVLVNQVETRPGGRQDHERRPEHANRP